MAKKSAIFVEDLETIESMHRDYRALSSCVLAPIFLATYIYIPRYTSHMSHVAEANTELAAHALQVPPLPFVVAVGVAALAAPLELRLKLPLGLSARRPRVEPSPLCVTRSPRGLRTHFFKKVRTRPLTSRIGRMLLRIKAIA